MVSQKRGRREGREGKRASSAVVRRQAPVGDGHVGRGKVVGRLEVGPLRTVVQKGKPSVSFLPSERKPKERRKGRKAEDALKQHLDNLRPGVKRDNQNLSVAVVLVRRHGVPIGGGRVRGDAGSGEGREGARRGGAEGRDERLGTELEGSGCG